MHDHAWPCMFVSPLPPFSPLTDTVWHSSFTLVSLSVRWLAVTVILGKIDDHRSGESVICSPQFSNLCITLAACDYSEKKTITVYLGRAVKTVYLKKKNIRSMRCIVLVVTNKDRGPPFLYWWFSCSCWAIFLLEQVQQQHLKQVKYVIGGENWKMKAAILMTREK